MPFLGSNRLFSLNRPRLYAPQKMRAKKKQKKRTRRRSWPNKKNGTCRVSSLKKDIFGTLFFLEKPINPSLVLFVSRQNGREGKNYIRRYLFVFLYFFFTAIDGCIAIDRKTDQWPSRTDCFLYNHRLHHFGWLFIGIPTTNRAFWTSRIRRTRETQ